MRNAEIEMGKMTAHLVRQILRFRAEKQYFAEKKGPNKI